MANVAKLKGKGAPPKLEAAPNNVSLAPRGKTNILKQEPKQALQLKLPVQIYEDFSKEAGRVCGFKKGSKVELFQLIWNAYKRSELNPLDT